MHTACAIAVKPERISMKLRQFINHAPSCGLHPRTKKIMKHCHRGCDNCVMDFSIDSSFRECSKVIWDKFIKVKP